ncbi:very-long-chain 3-oxoacyl-CoA reductase-B-like [Galendromus occidentalis]|uniref:Very-long-chain 3-oxoacyl-CoA reductase-B-like n=1 Tax=Galendromus occidentalis TaxID=34638 RepID=A0AAJ7SD90_9ACAR|nr:very-long-chain 3-oxoacyl-CoA reductase-B-like [Galendromus occidentalis]XP_028966548.1 very-long-chain 3-oxoacyl-CoA reductase-B-like [Galendromus occidentalis]
MEQACVFQNPDMSFASRFIAYSGLLFLILGTLRLLQSLVRGAYHCFLGQLLGHNVNFKKFAGKWAVVTGASDGIGRAYAEQLAQKGINICLISRTQSKLDEVAAVIQDKFKVETKTLSVDFSSNDRGCYEVIRKLISNLEVAVLVNNVGMSFPYPEYFTEVPDGDHLMDQMIQANCTSGTLMMRLVLPGMASRHSGVVINVSSLSNMYPLPLLGVYAGTKSYMEFLSQATACEYQNLGVIVQSVKPAFVSTKMSKIRKASLNVPTPDAYVRQALTTVGLETSTYGYIPHKIRGYFQEVAFNSMPLHCMLSLSLRMMSGLRALRYKKDKREDPIQQLKKRQ